MQKIGRNDPCPCGSGKKYKQCCGSLGEVHEGMAHTVYTLPSNSFQAALDHHQAGRLPQAEAIYRQILQMVPNHPDALHLLGLTARLAGKNEIAVELISKAIGVSASSQMFFNLGVVLRAQRKLDAAIDSYQRALVLKPNYAEAHSNLGGALKEQGKLDEAIESYRKAIALKPKYAEAHNNLGLALHKQGLIYASHVLEHFGRYAYKVVAHGMVSGAKTRRYAAYVGS